MANSALEMAKSAQESVDQASGQLDMISDFAASAASRTSVSELKQSLDQLQSEVPSTSDLARVKTQLASLESGMQVLEGLSQLRSDVGALTSKSLKIDQLVASVELSKEDILQVQNGLARAQEQQSITDELTKNLAKHLDEMEGMAGELDSVSTQVSS
jgi:hypothetical protein